VILFVSVSKFVFNAIDGWGSNGGIGRTAEFLYANIRCSLAVCRLGVLIFVMRAPVLVDSFPSHV